MKTWMWVAGAVVIGGGAYYLYTSSVTSAANAKKLATTVASMQPVGTPYLASTGLTVQKVALYMNDASTYVYIFPVAALPNVAQLQGQTMASAAKVVSALGGIPADTTMQLLAA